MRADRLLSIMLLLQTYGRITTAELADRLEVSERTIHRDMEALGSAGVPVMAMRGTGGGWQLMDEYKTNLTGLHEEEIASLFVGAPERVLHDLGLRRASEGALIKLLAALPSVGRRTAEFVRERIHIDASGWHDSGESVEPLPLLQEAVLRERQVKLSYDKGRAGVSERVVDPLGLVIKGTVWYLVAGVQGEPRTYRIARIVRCEMLDEASTRPPGFQLASYWEASTEQFVTTLPRFEAAFRIDEAYKHLTMYWKYSKVLEQGTAGEDGRVPCRMQFQSEEEACRFALSLGPHGELAEPAELRTKVAEMARGAAALYGEP